VILQLTLVLPLLVASAGDCYLVTNDEIDEIPCDFSAASTDALRYSAEDDPEAKAKRAEEAQRDANRQRGPKYRAFRRGSRGDRGR
jgi:hypothetical protein